jgi:hypothetical protein
MWMMCERVHSRGVYEPRGWQNRKGRVALLVSWRVRVAFGTGQSEPAINETARKSDTTPVILEGCGGAR